MIARYLQGTRYKNSYKPKGTWSHLVSRSPTWDSYTILRAYLAHDPFPPPSYLSIDAIHERHRGSQLRIVVLLDKPSEYSRLPNLASSPQYTSPPSPAYLTRALVRHHSRANVSKIRSLTSPLGSDQSSSYTILSNSSSLSFPLKMKTPASFVHLYMNHQPFDSSRALLSLTFNMVRKREFQSNVHPGMPRMLGTCLTRFSISSVSLSWAHEPSILVVGISSQRGEEPGARR